MPKFKFSNKAFTLIELLIVIAILAILATVTLLVINPVQMIKQSRDSNRIADLNQLNKGLLLFQTIASGTSMGTHGTVYVSILSDQADCSDLGLPALGGGYVYSCSNSTNYRKMDGTGWVPVNFTSIQDQAGAIFTSLPIDPSNTVTDSYYYTYIPGSWALSATMESTKYSEVNASTDGGQSTTRYEIGNELTLNENLEFVCGDTLIDSRDSQEYTTVEIGTQCWMAENLNVGTMITSCTNGYVGVCTTGGDTVQNQGTSCSSIQKWCANNLESNCTLFGGWYQWNQAMCGSTTAGAQGICPTSWHFPSDDEWYALENYLKDEGQTCNAARNNVYDCTPTATKLKVGGSTDFNARYSGLIYQTGNTSADFNVNGSYFWTSTQYDATRAPFRFLYSSYAGIRRDSAVLKGVALGIRCIKD